MATPTSPGRPLSLWHDDPTYVPVTAAPLNGDTTVDVAIIGAGYTGLWTAYYLKKGQPDLRVAVIEAETVGLESFPQHPYSRLKSRVVDAVTTPNTTPNSG